MFEASSGGRRLMPLRRIDCSDNRDCYRFQEMRQIGVNSNKSFLWCTSSWTTIEQADVRNAELLSRARAERTIVRANSRE
jgi:hypothetical protein